MNATTGNDTRPSLAPTGILAGLVVAIGVVDYVGASVRARNPSGDTPAYRFLTGAGIALFVSLGIVRGALFEGGLAGCEESLRAADVFLTVEALSQVTKQVVEEGRPDGSTSNSFPSGHASAVFAIAALESRYHPAETVLWFLGALLLSDSRVRLQRHYFQDVFAGAVLGVITAEAERRRPQGVLIAPLYRLAGETAGR